jgi:hypothetical protein
MYIMKMLAKLVYLKFTVLWVPREAGNLRCDNDYDHGSTERLITFYAL